MDAVSIHDEVGHLSLPKKKGKPLKALQSSFPASTMLRIARDKELLHKRVRQLKRLLVKKEKEIEILREEIRALKGESNA